MEKIKAGVIGVGYLGKFHAQKYAAMENVDLVGVADVDSKNAAEIAAENNCKPFADYREMLPFVDAVSIVVPTTLHHEVGLACLYAGVDVMMEKPMTVTLAEADSLIDVAKENDRILQVGHLERYNPAVLAMEEYLHQPMFIESDRIQMFSLRGTDVDVVLDLMIHDIDIILSIVDSPIKTIHTVGVPVVTSTTDIANARLIFENGCTANITVSRISKKTERRLRIFQPKSYIAVDYGKKDIMVIRLTDKPGPLGIPKEEILNTTFEESDALAAELVDFVANVQNRTKPKVSGKEGRNALAVAQEILVQIKEHSELYKQQLSAS